MTQPTDLLLSFAMPDAPQSTVNNLWKAIAEVKPAVGVLVMVCHLDPDKKPYNVTVACLGSDGHFHFTPFQTKTIGWVPTHFKSRF